MDLLTLSESMVEKEISPVELVEQSLEKIKATNPLYNTYITVCEEEAKKQAIIAEKEIASGEIKGPLHGVPIAIKDVVYTKGIKTTMGSEIYKDYVPEEDATVVKRLKDAGAIIIGKAHTHEFAFGPTGDRSYFGPCKNPFDTSKITGGSSSGSAVSVATDTVPLSIGTDTGGSIRIPASACGVVGMKPTFGLVSKYGIHNTAYSLDHPGPMSKTIKDNAILLNILAGYDQKDPDSLLKSREDYTRFIGQEIDGKVIGIPSYFFNQINEEISELMEKVIDVYQGLGARIIEVELESLEEIAAAQIITIQSEAASVHEENMNDRSSAFGSELLKRLQMSSKVPAFKYVQAQQRKQAYISNFNKVFQEVDVLLTPTMPILPTDLDQREVLVDGEEELVRNALLRLTSPINYTGNPAISIPGGKSLTGLPIGFQLIGNHQTEAILYQIGHAFEETVQM